MSWLSLSLVHLQESLAAAELSALQTLQLAAGQADPAPAALREAAFLVRGYVSHRYQVGEPGTVPAELLGPAKAVARWYLLSRLPAKAMATDARRQQYEDAISTLKDVAGGKFSITEPLIADADQPGPATGSAFGSRPTIFPPA